MGTNIHIIHIEECAQIFILYILRSAHKYSYYTYWGVGTNIHIKHPGQRAHILILNILGRGHTYLYWIYSAGGTHIYIEYTRQGAQIYVPRHDICCCILWYLDSRLNSQNAAVKGVFLKILTWTVKLSRNIKNTSCKALTNRKNLNFF